MKPYWQTPILASIEESKDQTAGLITTKDYNNELTAQN
jgi:hypothetical protein